MRLFLWLSLALLLSACSNSSESSIDESFAPQSSHERRISGDGTDADQLFQHFNQYSGD